MKKKFFSFLMLFTVCCFACSKNNLKNDDSIVDTKSEERETEITEIIETEINEKTELQLLTLDEEEPVSFDKTKIYDNVSMYPVVDGSTALMPLMSKIMEKACGISKDESENKTTCSKTANAWRNLFHKKADLLIVGEMPQTVKWELDPNNYYDTYGDPFTELLYAPIRREGLVFITHKDNPIDSLSTDELIKIYTGEITNWSRVGGNNVKIKAYQRNATSGSQANFIKCLMKDIEPTKMEADYYVGDMAGLAEKVKIYENNECAIGYSVYYYINNMILNDNLKILKVNGIMPSNETIANGTYPLLTESFVAIRKDEPVDSDVRKLYNYIRSNKGKEAIIEANYVPVE